MVWLDFMDGRHTKSFHAVLPSWLLQYLFIFERETDRPQAGEGERERETQNLKQAPGSELSAQSPTQGLTPGTVRS